MTQTLSEENYLKAIYHVEKQGNGKVSVTPIASKERLTPLQVALRARGWIE